MGIKIHTASINRLFCQVGYKAVSYSLPGEAQGLLFEIIILKFSLCDLYQPRQKEILQQANALNFNVLFLLIVVAGCRSAGRS